MLCPEVWNFKAPESTFSTQKHDPDERSHLHTINNFIYNHLVSVILPDTPTVPETLTELLDNDCDYYKITNVKLSEFVDKDFIKNFVHSGNLYVLSIGTRIDCDNCVAVTPEGQLILNLNKPTYQSFGLEGSVSHFHSITKDKYVVTIDLKKKCLRPGKPLYERTKTCLEKLSHDLIVTWEPPKEDICPSSVAKFFHDAGYTVKQREIKHNSHVIHRPPVPELAGDNSFEFAEWLGMVALHARLTGGAPDNHVTTYETPEPNHVTGALKFLQWRGFFTANRIARFYDKLSEFKKSKGCEWAALYVQGFSDSPIAWRGEEHHFYTNGDNSYAFVLTNDETVSFVQKCSRKRYSNKRKGKPL